MSKYKDIHIARQLTYIGIDESTLGVGSGSVIMVAAETNDKSLTEELGSDSLLKSANYLKNGIKPPSLEKLKAQGLNKFYWLRVNSGKAFKRQIVAHAGIGQLVKANGYKPESTVLYIDAFYKNGSEDLIKDYLMQEQFNIPIQNIHIIGGGDRSIPIINFADLLAFQIGYMLGEQHGNNSNSNTSEFIHEAFNFESQRIEPISKSSRQILEDIMEERN